MTESERDLMRVAIEKTLALHQKVVDGVYFSYSKAKMKENDDDCYLCDEYFNCKDCPWFIFEAVVCHEATEATLDYDDSEASIVRLNRWLKLLEEL